jgi:hypothetical protein
MRYQGMIVVGALLLSTFPGPVSAGEIRGVIVRVDLERGELQVEGRGLGRRGLAMSFTLGKGTQVLFGRESGALSDLAPGKRIRVVFDGPGRRVLSLHLFGFRPARKETVSPPRISAASTVSGLLMRVSYAERELVVIGPGSAGPETETIIHVPKEPRVSQDGKLIPFEDLKDGREAKIQVEKQGNRLLARDIQVGAPVPETPAEGRIARIRRILRVADRLLELAEGMSGNRPEPTPMPMTMPKADSEPRPRD